MVTVVDPSYHLFGRTFPLLGIVSKAYLGRCCVIRLDATEQFVPLAATDRSAEPLAVYPLPLSLYALRQLVAEYARIELQLTEDTGDEHYQAADDDGFASSANPKVSGDHANPDAAQRTLGAVKPRATQVVFQAVVWACLSLVSSSTSPKETLVHE